MSHICLQFGQCGNQLGQEFFSVINDDIIAKNTGVPGKQNLNYCTKSRDKWFRERDKNNKLVARAILVDTESKVIKSLIGVPKSNSIWEYGKYNCVAQCSGGAGNNWALGYYEQGPHVFEQTMDSVRKECERCDRLQSFLCFSSSAGGTGSGVGSYMTEKLRDELPNKFLMNVVILPYKSGEVITQNYNMLFSLSKLYNKSDGIFFIENDTIHKLTTHDLKIKSINYSDINNLIAQQVASVFQPVTDSCNINDALLDLVAHHSYKILTIKTAPHVPLPSSPFDSTPSWEGLKRVMKRSLCEPYEVPLYRNKSSTNTNNFEYSSSIGNILISRGSDSFCVTKEASESETSFINSKPTKELPRYQYFCDDRKFYNKDRFITLISNNSLLTKLLDDCIDKAWKTFIHNAYVHQYTKYGVENEDFLEMFLKTESILKDYKSL